MNGFKDVKGYHGKYGVNDRGDVISYKRWRKPESTLLKPWLSKRGYLSVKLQLTNRLDQKTVTVHRLVAEAFLPDWNPLLCVNHIDGDKTNNRVNNLEIVTLTENMKHAYRTGLIVNDGENSSSSKLKKEDVFFIRESFSSKLYTQKQMANHFKVNPSTISDVIRFKTWKNIGVKA